MVDRPHFKICLVASGGGHLRQLMQLKLLIESHECFFVTESTPLGETVALQHHTRFVPHFAFGQRRLEGYPRFLWSGMKSWLASCWILIAERPDAIVSTGAGTAFFTLLLGWLLGRKVVYIESIARVKTISLFGRLVSRFVGLYVVQWPDISGALSNVRYCQSLRIIETAPDDSQENRQKILVTIGTFVPFDRLVSAVQDLRNRGVLVSDVIAQVGDSKETFAGLTTFPSCSYTEMQELMNQSSLVICHGGSGSILSALEAGCRVVALARKPEFGEVYDNHQIELIAAMEGQGLIVGAHDEHDLERAINEAFRLPNRRVETDTAMIVGEIEAYLGYIP